MTGGRFARNDGLDRAALGIWLLVCRVGYTYVNSFCYDEGIQPPELEPGGLDGWIAASVGAAQQCICCHCER